MYRGDRQVAHLGNSPAEHQKPAPQTVHYNATTSCGKYMRVKEVIKQGNRINLCYLFLWDYNAAPDFGGLRWWCLG
jgi:hypothetical protein